MKKFSFIAASLFLITVEAQNKDSVSIGPIPDYELSELIIEGNRIQTPFSRTTTDIRIISRQQIETMPVKSVNELLSYVGGVDIRQRGPFGAQTDISVDGGTSEQTLVLINGVKMLDSQSAHNMMNLPVPMSAIDHIEIISGPAARIYGINALTGAVNIVTRKGKTDFVTADFQTGSSFRKKEEGDGSGIYGGGSLEAAAHLGSERQSHLFSAGQTLYNGQRYNSSSKTTKFFYTGHYNFNSRNEISLMAGYAGSRFGASGFYAAPGDKEAEELVGSSVVSLSSNHKFGKLRLMPRISNRYGEDDYRYFRHNLSKARSRHYTNALMAELNAGLETAIGTFGFGWESRFEKISSSNIGDHSRDNHGAYVELDTGLTSRLKASLGGYLNYHSDYGWQLYPGIDLAWLISSSWKLTLGAGTGQRIPSFTDLYLNQPPGNIGNDRLRPESARNYEAGIHYTKNGLRVSASYFYRNISDFIDWVRTDENEPYSPVNLGRNRMQGFEFGISRDYRLSSDQTFGYRVSYNFLSPKLSENGSLQSKYVLESLKHQLILGVNYQISRLRFTVENRWIRRELSNSYLLTDLRLNYELNRFVVYTELTNLFDAEYREAGAVPMPPRWFSLGIRFMMNGM